MSKTYVIIGVFLFIILALGAAPFFLKHKSSVSDTASRASVSLPNTTLKSADGNDVNLSDFRGKPLVINLWASWCPFCKDELLNLAYLQREYGEKITVIAINRGESPGQIQKMRQELGIGTSSVMLLDSDDTLYQTLGGFAMPEILFVNKDGMIRQHQRGLISREELRRRVQDLVQR
ncbi:MAG: TlpA family protein disulfide reductase [Candidatus Sungbacteria bacterium]|nr:TlpA family protein disulfide reductase [Candidatus Sungbacteria bacterium]